MQKTKLPKSDAVIYCRVSTKEQLANLSLPVQEQTCRKWCENNRYRVAALFKEAESAKTLNRTEFQRMLDFCALNKKTVGIVLFYDASRFSRENSEYQSVRALLRVQGIETRSATQPFDNSPAGEFTESLFSAYATLDNRIRAMRTTEGMKEAIRLGHWVHRAPLGYENVPNAAHDEPNLRPDHERAPLIAKAFELFGMNTYQKAEVLAIVTEMGLTDRSGRQLSPQTFDKMLKNATYSGWIVSSWGFKARGQFKALVSEEQFGRVQQILAGRRRSAPSKLSDHPDFPLRVFARCGVCGTPLTGSYSTGKLGGKYGYYHCREKTCKEPGIRKDTLHLDFAVLIESMRPRPEFWALLKVVLSEVCAVKQAQQTETLARSRKRLDTLESKKQKLIDALLDGKLSQTIFDDQLEKVEAEIARHSVPSETVENPADVDNLLSFGEWFLDNAATVWIGASPDKKRLIQGAIFPSGVSVTKEGFGTLGHASVFMALQEQIDHQNEMASPEGFEPSLPP